MHDISYHHALERRNGARDPVDRVLLQKIANWLRIRVAQTEVQFALQTVSGFCQRESAQPAQHFRLARLNEILRLGSALAVSHDEEIGCCRPGDDSVPHISM